MAESQDGALAQPLGRARRLMFRAAGFWGVLSVVGGAAVLFLTSLAAVWAGASDAAVSLLQLFTVTLLTVAGAWWGRRVLSGADAPTALAQRLDEVSGLGSQAGFRAVWEMTRDAGRFGESAELRDAARRRLQALPAWESAPEDLARAERRRLVRPALGVAAAAALALGAALVAPGSSWHAVTALGGLSRWEDAWRRVPPPARLADFRITHRYPDYTGRRPRTINSASGRIRCLPGTEVQIRARSLEPVTEAALLLTGPEDEAAPEEIAVRVEGRELEASFVASRPGTWKFRTVVSGEVREERRAHPIELEVDEPPDVTLLEPRESPLEVNEKDVVELAYRARDDFGLGDVFVRWRVLETRREGREKLSTETGRTLIGGRGALELEPLGLEPGDRVSYSVEVADNDTVNGPKLGASRTRELRVYSRRDHHQRVQEQQEAALDELVHVLGDHLEQAFTASAIDTSLPAARARVARTAGAEDLLRQAEEASREDPLGRPEVAEAFARARIEIEARRRACRNAIRRIERSPDREAAARFLVGAEARMVDTLERQATYLADLSNDQRMLDAQALAEALRDEQRALKEALEAFRDAPDDEKRAALAQAIERIQRRIRELREELAKLQGSVPTEYVNRDAFQSRDAAQSLEKMRELVEEGRFDEAMEEVDRMLSQTEKMLAELREGRQELQSREYSEIAQRAEEIWQDLEDVRMRQEELARRTEQISRAVRERSRERVKASDPFIERQVERLERARREIESVRPDDARPEADAFGAAEQRIDDGIRALRAKDFGAAREVLEQGRDQVFDLEREMARRAQQLRRFGALFGDAEQIDRARRRLAEARPRIEEVLKDLEEMVPDPDKMLSEDERSVLDEMAQMQADLAERAEGLGQRLRELGEQLPIVGPEVGEKVDEARGAMEGARDRLKGHDAPGGLGEERRALESLAQLKEQLQQMGDGQPGRGGVPLPFGGRTGQPRRGEGSGRDLRTSERVEIPQPEEFEAPAEFREDILEAAKQGTVEQFRDVVRRYYEELVK